MYHPLLGTVNTQLPLKCSGSGESQWQTLEKETINESFSTV